MNNEFKMPSFLQQILVIAVIFVALLGMKYIQYIGSYIPFIVYSSNYLSFFDVA